MENVVFTNLSIPEIRQLFRQELETYFEANKQPEQTPTDQPEQLLSIQQAAEFLRLSVPTLYSKVSKREIPFMKAGKRLYFSRVELMEYVKTGRKNTITELKQATESHLSDTKKGLNNGK
jgi:excisionase family DNA binding protein